MKITPTIGLIGLGLGVFAGVSRPEPMSPAARCQVGKIKASGKFLSCQNLEAAKTIAKGTGNPARCTDKLNAVFAKLEASAGSLCPTTGDAFGVSLRLDGAANDIQAALSGIRFIDNGDGTITDTRTGLMWEKKDKSSSSSLNHVDVYYPWGFTVEWWLAQLNGLSSDGSSQVGFAGHSDWRLPTLDEIGTLDDSTTCPGTSSGGPCIAWAFKEPCQPGCTVDSCSCTADCIHYTCKYWTSTTRECPGGGVCHWTYDFLGGADLEDGLVYHHARAVRGARVPEQCHAEDRYYSYVCKGTCGADTACLADGQGGCTCSAVPTCIPAGRSCVAGVPCCPGLVCQAGPLPSGPVCTVI